MTDCVFCKIFKDEVKVNVRDRSFGWIAFDSNLPEAPTHVVVTTRQHIPDLSDETVNTVLAHAVQETVAALGLKSYRVVMNVGPDAGQTVQHLHAHILSGRPLGDIASPSP